MSVTTPVTAALDEDPAMKAHKEIVDFVADFTIETTPGSAAKTPSYRDHLAAGTKIAVTFLPGSDYADTVATAQRLKGEGLIPLPHIAARSLPSQKALEDFLGRLQGEVGIDEVVALAGAVDKPLGPFDSSMKVLETGLLDRHGIKTIGVAGHPEGSPDISEKGLAEALAWKNDFAQRSDAELYIATQFCFESAPIIAWDKAIRASGNRLPIHIGVPGLATIKTLINHAKACGVGPSMRVLTRQARNIAKLMSVNAPDSLVLELARYKANDPDCGIRRAHFYPLGGLRRTAAWARAVAEGDFTLHRNGRGFSVNRVIE